MRAARLPPMVAPRINTQINTIRKARISVSVSIAEGAPQGARKLLIRYRITGVGTVATKKRAVIGTFRTLAKHRGGKYCEGASGYCQYFSRDQRVQISVSIWHGPFDRDQGGKLKAA
jgi:hypothetical protein